MSGRSRLALAKTARYCVLERRGDARSVRAAPGSSSRGRDRGSLPNGASPKQQEKTAAVGGRDAPSRPAQSSRRSEQTGAEEASSFPGTERLYMLDTYLMSAGENIMFRVLGVFESEAFVCFFLSACSCCFSRDSSAHGLSRARFLVRDSGVCVAHPAWLCPRVAEATVIGTARDEKQGLAVILDRTIFHPQGGGQPSDCGESSSGCTRFAQSIWWMVKSDLHRRPGNNLFGVDFCFVKSRAPWFN